MEEGRDIIDSHDPLIVIKDKLGYFAADQIIEDTPPEVNKHHGIVCCDRIHIVYGDFDKNDPLQKYKKYRVTYYAMPMQNNENVKLDKYTMVYERELIFNKWFSVSNYSIEYIQVI